MVKRDGYPQFARLGCDTLTTMIIRKKDRLGFSHTPGSGGGGLRARVREGKKEAGAIKALPFFRDASRRMEEEEGEEGRGKGWRREGGGRERRSLSTDYCYYTLFPPPLTLLLMVGGVLDRSRSSE